MARGRTWLAAGLMLAITSAASVRAAPAQPSGRRRALSTQAKAPPDRRPPDVRKGETYDGRERRPSRESVLMAVPRLLLFLPRAAVAVASGVTLAALGWWEQSGLGSLLHRVCFAFDGRLTVLPTIAWERGLVPVAGASLTTDLLFGRARRAGLHAEAAAGQTNVWQALLKLFPLGLVPGNPERGRRLHLVVTTSYVRRHDLPHYGRSFQRPAAGQTSADAQARLDAEIFRAQATLQVRLWRSLTLAAALGADWRNLREYREPTATTTPTTATALQDQRLGQDTTFTTGLTLAVGEPLGRLVPRPGFRARIAALARVGDDETGRHLLLGGDLEGFVGLWGNHRRLGIRVRMEGVARLDARPVPLLYLPTLGGPNTMRGFVTGRFTGESVALIAAEYHMALHRRLWLSLFVDWGGALGEAFSDSSWSAVDVGGGAGLGLRITRYNWMRLQVAGSRDGVAVFIGWGGAP